ncbi:MAG: hypothetical protein H8D62_00615 [Bacteroidetes bacterium]|nr:hypothetical protein [Bacteroidota bacterium]
MKKNVKALMICLVASLVMGVSVKASAQNLRAEMVSGDSTYIFDHDTSEIILVEKTDGNHIVILEQEDVFFLDLYDLDEYDTSQRTVTFHRVDGQVITNLYDAIDLTIEVHGDIVEKIIVSPRIEKL